VREYHRAIFILIFFLVKGREFRKKPNFHKKIAGNSPQKNVVFFLCQNASFIFVVVIKIYLKKNYFTALFYGIFFIITVRI
jgi:hypothetical protein